MKCATTSPSALSIFPNTVSPMLIDVDVVLVLFGEFLVIWPLVLTSNDFFAFFCESTVQHQLFLIASSETMMFDFNAAVFASPKYVRFAC